MKKIIKVFRSYAEQEKWEIEFQTGLTPDQRQRIAKTLKKRVYGDARPDVREGQRKR
jgi:F0F1-type ATP synthase delta subunit